MPFSELPEFMQIEVADIGIDAGATPSYADVLTLRADRVARISEHHRFARRDLDLIEGTAAGRL